MQCELCFVVRAKCEARKGSGGHSPLDINSWRENDSRQGSGSGSRGSGDGDLLEIDPKKIDEPGVANLSLREASLWGRLVELRDRPAQDSLGDFPTGLGEFILFSYIFIDSSAVAVLSKIYNGMFYHLLPSPTYIQLSDCCLVSLFTSISAFISFLGAAQVVHQE